MISSTHLHAMAIHFPIALLILGFVSELVAIFYQRNFLTQSAFYLLLTGTAGLVVSFLSGDAAGEGIEEGSFKTALNLHEQAATVSLWLGIVTSALYSALYFFKWDSKWIKVVCIILFAGVVVALARTGYLGGQLVYKHSAGVELALPDFSSPS